MRLAEPATEPLHDAIIQESKESKLRDMMREFGTVLVAYSGGVDSAYLSKIATEELGRDALCVMGISPSVSAYQRAEAERIASENGFRFEVVETSEIEDTRYTINQPNRCYFCKTELYTRLGSLARERRIAAIVDGTNADDIGDHRPGHAAARELNVRSPLAELGFSKAEIREQSYQLGLATWDKPSSPCLSSRIAYGTPVSIERLSVVERGEEFLRNLGFREFRVRVHGELVRLEISADEMSAALNLDIVGRFSKTFKALGFRYVTLDLEGFRSGSLNRDR